MVVVGIQGREGVGKDFVSSELKKLIETSGKKCKIISFSDFVREHAAQEMYKEHNLTIEECRNRCNNPKNKNEYYFDIGTTPRQYTCKKSDELKKDDPYVFIRMWIDEIYSNPLYQDWVIINPSIRTEDEADAIENMDNSIHVRVVNTLKHSETVDVSKLHVTEMVIDKYPVITIRNDWSEDEELQKNDMFEHELSTLHGFIVHLMNGNVAEKRSLSCRP